MDPSSSAWCVPETTPVVCTAGKVWSVLALARPFCAVLAGASEGILGFVMLSSIGGDIKTSPGRRGESSQAGSARASQITEARARKRERGSARVCKKVRRMKWVY